MGRHTSSRACQGLIPAVATEVMPAGRADVAGAEVEADTNAEVAAQTAAEVAAMADMGTAVAAAALASSTNRETAILVPAAPSNTRQHLVTSSLLDPAQMAKGACCPTTQRTWPSPYRLKL